MAEQSGNSYQDISSNKLVNKEGLLELSVKIKDYVNANAGGSGVNIRVMDPDNLTNDDKTYLANFYNGGNIDIINYPCVFQKGRDFYYYVGGLTGYKYIYFMGLTAAGNGTKNSISCNRCYRVYFNSSNEFQSIYYIVNGVSGFIFGIDGNGLIASYNADNLPSNTAYNSVDKEFKYIKDYYATKAELPSQYTLPTASTSTLGGVKVDGTTITIDANGVISSSGGSGGGGTTYTAGTGISITNGVISLNLNNAEGGEY